MSFQTIFNIQQSMTVNNRRTVGQQVARSGYITVAQYLTAVPWVFTRLNSSHITISYAVFCLKKKIQRTQCWREKDLKQEYTTIEKQNTHKST